MMETLEFADYLIRRMKSTQEILDFIIATRERRGFTQLQVANAIGMDKGNYSKLESGQLQLKTEIQLKIFEVLGLEFIAYDKTALDNEKISHLLQTMEQQVGELNNSSDKLIQLIKIFLLKKNEK